jgi:sporulation protein YlmC with PRC-barrel domain
MLLSDLTKLKVYDSKAKFVGRIQDFEIDGKTMVPSAIVLELDDSVSKELFGSKPLIGKTAARASVQLIDRLGDAVILKNSIDELKGSFEKI